MSNNELRGFYASADSMKQSINLSREKQRNDQAHKDKNETKL
jgi:hypothetical protein